MVSVMLICVRNMELTYELHKAIKLNFINASNNAVVVYSRCFRLGTLSTLPHKTCHRNTMATPKATLNSSTRT